VQERMPKDPRDAQIIPLAPRPFPDVLRDPDLLPSQLRPSDVALAAWGALLLIGLPVVIWRWWRRRARA